MSIKPTFG
ncbi:hypothetical protein AYI68_g4478, partial [Smittium mucronatum]